MRKRFIAVMGIVILTTTACSTFKVTDPADPKFNPDKFQFEDYRGIPQMTDALKKLFPVGTPKEFVERVLVQEGGAVLGNIKKAERIEKNNKSRKRETREQECAIMMPVRDIYIYIKTPDYFLPNFPNRLWNIGIQYDDADRTTLVKLNGTLVSGTINCEELR